MRATQLENQQGSFQVVSDDHQVPRSGHSHALRPREGLLLGGSDAVMQTSGLLEDNDRVLRALTHNEAPLSVYVEVERLKDAVQRNGADDDSVETEHLDASGLIAVRLQDVHSITHADRSGVVDRSAGEEGRVRVLGEAVDLVRLSVADVPVSRAGHVECGHV